MYQSTAHINILGNSSPVWYTVVGYPFTAERYGEWVLQLVPVLQGNLESAIQQAPLDNLVLWPVQPPFLASRLTFASFCANSGTYRVIVT